MMSPLQKYMLQRQLTDGGYGAGGKVATPMGSGMADPYMGGDAAEPLVNPEDAQNEFDAKRRARAYMPGPDTMGTPSGGPF